MVWAPHVSSPMSWLLFWQELYLKKNPTNIKRKRKKVCFFRKDPSIHRVNSSKFCNFSGSDWIQTKVYKKNTYQYIHSIVVRILQMIASNIIVSFVLGNWNFGFIPQLQLSSAPYLNKSWCLRMFYFKKRCIWPIFLICHLCELCSMFGT